MRFSYLATTKEGKNVSGSAEASDRSGLIVSLHKQGLQPVLIEVAKAGAAKKGLLQKRQKVKLQDLVVFTRQLSTMIAAGVPLARSLSALENDTQNAYFRTVLASVTKDVESGLPLSGAFEKFPNVFSDVYTNMVKAGETAGILDDILKRLAIQVELDASIRKKIQSAMMYPTVILCITIIAFFAIMLFIVPKLGGLISSLAGPGYKLPVYSQFLLNISHFFDQPTIMKHLIPVKSIYKFFPNLILFAAVFLAMVLYLLRYIKTPKGLYRFHLVLLKIPVIKVIILKIAIARFSRTFASLMGAGVSVLDSLDVTGAAIGNKVIEAELKAAAKEVKNGKPLSEPISRSAHFPPIVAQMLLVGEETGQIDQVLSKIADFYEEEVAVLIDGLSAVIEPVMIVFLGAGVGLIAASVMGPIANLSKDIGNNQ